MTEHPGRFTNQQVLITQADRYMGPAIAERFEAEAAHVIRDLGPYDHDPEEAGRVVGRAGKIDILIVNLLPDQVVRRSVPDTDETQWQDMFKAMAHPTLRFVRAVLPQMIERRQGKIIVVTSAAPLRGIPCSAAYTAARGAQNAYVRAVGAEVARHNVQINAVAQHFVFGGYPANAMELPGMRDEAMRDVPAQRFAEGWEQAELVLFLASPNSNFICGQAIPFAGGWVTST